jgi:hypothetical protein
MPKNGARVAGLVDAGLPPAKRLALLLGGTGQSVRVVPLSQVNTVGLGNYVKAALGLGDDYIWTWTDVNDAWDKFVHIT